jgi:hypothetical protein
MKITVIVEGGKVIATAAAGINMGAAVAFAPVPSRGGEVVEVEMDDVAGLSAGDFHERLQKVIDEKGRRGKSEKGRPGKRK